jgi:hypothetical protein
MGRRIARILPAAAVLGGLVALTVAITPARANGNPLTITLSYLDGVSNWGPTNAAGVAEMVGKEGELRLVANGLPQLGSEQYEVWILNTTRGDRMALGSFSAGDGGVGKLDLILDEPIPDKQWNMMMITVEPEAGQPSAPGARHSIAGRFPTASSAGRPGELPRTGGAAVESAPMAVTAPVMDAEVGVGLSGALLAVCAVAFIICGFALGRRTSRGKAQ